MATLMQPSPAAHRDHAASFDRSRPSSAPFASSSFDRAPSPAGPPVRSRTGSNNSASPAPSPVTPAPSGYPQQQQQQQQYAATSYFPPSGPHYPVVQPAWPNTPVPATSFYAPPFNPYPNGAAPSPVYQQPDFSAWAHVYSQMVAGGHMPGPGHMPQQQAAQHPQDLDDYSAASDPPRRRTTSGPASPRAGMTGLSASQSSAPPKGLQPAQGFHPYKRGPSHRPSPSSESGMSRSTSQPSVSLSDYAKGGPASSSVDEHRRTTSDASGTDLVPPPKLRDRQYSSSSDRSSRDGRGDGAKSPPSSQPRTSSPSVTSPPNISRPPSTSSSSKGAVQGASAAAPASALPSRSPLSKSGPLPELPTSSSNTKGRARNDPSPPQSSSSRSKGSAPPSLSRSLAPVNVNVPQDFAPPSAPFANVQAMGSDVSLAETERTTQTTASKAPKRGLFRMKNKSTDNISLSSTVSSASMMIRKMGSLGKLARRNSLMGISKIFKDKPKDEDAPIPEKQASILSFKKKSGKKATAAPAEISRAHAELDRVSEEDDRVLSGLSPAAQLARQHTQRSRREAERKVAESKPADRKAAAESNKKASTTEFGGPSGEPTWDINTAARPGQPQQKAADMDTPAPSASISSPNGTSVVRVLPHSPTVVHAFAVNGQEYDSDDTSEGEAVDDVTSRMLNASLDEDDDFQPLWARPHIDRYAQPKKGILRTVVSNEHLELAASRPTPPAVEPTRAPAARANPSLLPSLPAPTPERIDGVAHAAHTADRPEAAYDPLSPDFSPFDSTPIQLDLRPSIFTQPALNTSAPNLSLAGGGPVPPPQTRSMTAPARRRLVWAPECAVYSTYDAGTYDRRSEPATCNRLTPELAMSIKQELNAFKLEMPVHPSSRVYTHYFA
ncbi:Protein BNI4 [Vanrija pseudolonga]|uniref:Protein BNI4 n=1 Tax=Vanrija pseudolonga TaxID=143232 RepID=A0AAF0Y6D1_9TREE|nr:Protein BNI4 [Vanrija pseudolonga]